MSPARQVLSLPNVLSLGRIVLAPLIVYALLRGEPGPALLLLLLAGISDMLDGLIARFLDQRTVVGSYLDPLADKLLLISTMVALFHLGAVPLYLFLAVIFRDVLIVVGAISYELVTRNLRMEPTLVSKATTAAQIVCLLLLIWNMEWPLPPPWLDLSIRLAFALTVASGLHYLIVWTRKAVTATE